MTLTRQSEIGFNENRNSLMNWLRNSRRVLRVYNRPLIRLRHHKTISHTLIVLNRQRTISSLSLHYPEASILRILHELHTKEAYLDITLLLVDLDLLDLDLPGLVDLLDLLTIQILTTTDHLDLDYNFLD